MSNRLYIQPTKFVDIPNGETTYGVRVFDDYDAKYDNNWESIPDDDMEVLRKVKQDSSFDDFSN